MGYNGADWYRNIINVPNKWFLVVDEITAQEGGDYCLESRWALPMCCAFDGKDLVLAQYGPDSEGWVYLRLTGTGWQNQYMAPRLYRDFLNSPLHPFPRSMKDISRTTYYQTLLARRWTGKMEKGTTHVFANLFYEQSGVEEPFYRLRELGGGRYLVTDGKAGWIARADMDGKWLVAQVEGREIPAEAAVETKASPLLSADPDLRPAWQDRESVRVLSSTVMSVGDAGLYVVGLADGRIRVRRENGEIAVDSSMPGRVYALCPMDLDGDGSDELLAGSDTGGMHAFAADGNRLWTWTPPPWKRPDWARQSHRPSRTVITGIAPIDTNGDGEHEILVMGISWYILDREGKLLFFHEYTPCGNSWDGIVKEQTFVVAAGDVMGDGGDEIVGDLSGSGNAGGCWAVYVWDGKARGVQAHSANPSEEDYLWRHGRPSNRYAGSALKAVIATDFDGDGKDELAIASDAYVLQLGYYDCGPENESVWSCGLGSGANVMIGADVDGDGKAEIVVGTETGQVQALDAQKNRLFVADVSESVMALVARPEGAGHEIWAGTVNGKLFVLDAEGKIVSQGRLPGLIDHLAVSRDGAVLATTSGGYVALYLSTNTN